MANIESRSDIPNRLKKIVPETPRNEKLILEPKRRGRVSDTARRLELIVDKENKFRCSRSVIFSKI